MSANTDAWMPFYVGDYLGDTQRLTTEQHGAYLLLILDYWRNGPPPDDDGVLAQITRLDAKLWKRHRAALIRLFVVRDGEWHHKRIDRELDAAKENADRRSSKAKAAAEARWGNAKPDDQASPVDATSNATGIATSNAQRMPQAMLGECPPPSPSPKEEVKNKPPPVSARDKFAGCPPDLRRVCETGDFASVPNDGHLLREWLALPDMQLDRDILPLIERFSREEMARKGRKPFTLKFFDARVREKHAEDAAAIELMQRNRRRLERAEQEQSAATA